MKRFFVLSVLLASIVVSAPAFAAANPFADVPSGHWAYDAVAQLAADGVVSGYQSGTFSGSRPATRYEVASVVARALATVAENNAGKNDMELLKKLAVEFSDELSALGVKVDGIDKRMSLLEEGMGGWKLTGSFIFDASFSGNGWYNSNSADNAFDKNLFSLDLVKFIDKNTFFMAEMHAGTMSDGEGKGDFTNDKMHWHIAFLETKLPYDIDFRVGRWFEDFELWNGLYWANYEMNSMFGSYRLDGFRFHKNWGQFEATGILARNTRFDELMMTKTSGGNIAKDTELGDYMHYVFNLQWQPSDKFKIGGLAYIMRDDGGTANEYDMGINIFGLYADVALGHNIDLKGLYYQQKLDDGFKSLAEYSGGIMKGVDNTDPTAWKLILDVKQEALKFTSLWLQYSQIDNSFTLLNQQHVMNWSEREITPSITDNFPYGWDGRTTLMMVGAEQRWNDKWKTFEKYEKADYGKDWVDDAYNFTLGVTFQYTPAVAFQLIYDYIDYGDGSDDPMTLISYRAGSDHVLKFRTSVTF